MQQVLTDQMKAVPVKDFPREEKCLSKCVSFPKKLKEMPMTNSKLLDKIQPDKSILYSWLARFKF